MEISRTTDQSSSDYERAALEALEMHDAARAVELYGRALELCDPKAVEERVRLAERLAITARLAPERDAAEAAVARVLAERLTSANRGRVAFAHAVLLGYMQRSRDRVRALHVARAAFHEAGDAAGLARTLGALAIPTDGVLTVQDRVALGREGLAVAETADPLARAHCAGNVANAFLASADVEGAFTLWRQAVETLQGAGSGSHDDAVRYLQQWTYGALAVGEYDEAIRLVGVARARTLNPFWLARFAAFEAFAFWRRGDWRDALDSARQAASHEPGEAPFAVVDAITFEQTPHHIPKATQAGAREASIGLGSCLRASLDAEIRRARREPFPARGLSSIAAAIVRTGIRVGWADLALTAPLVDVTVAREVVSLLERLGAVGPREHASLRAARALLAAHDRAADATALLLEAAAAFEHLGEPLQRARLLEHAGHSMRAQRRGSGELYALAAGLYEQIGADRSLAQLLRSAGRTRALEGFRIPAKHRYKASPGLTRREREVAELAAQAYTAKEIGALLHISEATVWTHLARAKKVLGARRKSDLVRLLREREG